jgi:N-acyl homoserine lactone hydrolase
MEAVIDQPGPIELKTVKDPAGVGVGWVLRKFAGIQQTRAQPNTAEIIASEGVPPKGVMLSHIHLDHVSGLPDVPKGCPDLHRTP